MGFEEGVKAFAAVKFERYAIEKGWIREWIMEVVTERVVPSMPASIDFSD
jgi:hypothetical protein